MTVSNQGVQQDTTERSVQDRLVEAAEELFCRRGYNDTSVRELAAIAGCNVASVNYYFGGKDNLYVEVWRRRLVFLRENRLASIEKVMSAPNLPQLEDLLRSLHALRRGFPVGGFVAPKWSFTRPSRDVVHQICGPAGRAPISVMVRVS